MNRPKRIAVYPGTFDPITNGHIDVLERAVELFDEVIIAVAININKKPMFTAEERMDLIRHSIDGLGNTSVDRIDGLLVEYAAKKQACAIIRGLRLISDFEHELQMTQVNRKLNNKLVTVFMMPHESYSYLNSSVVKEVASYGGKIDCFVPEYVKKKLFEKLDEMGGLEQGSKELRS